MSVNTKWSYRCVLFFWLMVMLSPAVAKRISEPMTSLVARLLFVIVFLVLGWTRMTTISIIRCWGGAILYIRVGKLFQLIFSPAYSMVLHFRVPRFSYIQFGQYGFLSYLIKSDRSSIGESGFGFLIFSVRKASYFIFATAFPPSSSKAATSSSVNTSSFTDRICGSQDCYIGCYKGSYPSMAFYVYSISISKWHHFQLMISPPTICWMSPIYNGLIIHKEKRIEREQHRKRNKQNLLRDAYKSIMRRPS